MWSLTQLLKRDAFNWNDKVKLAFGQLKAALISAPILALLNFSIPFKLEAYASRRGVGAILMQIENQYPTSAALSPTYTNIS